MRITLVRLAPECRIWSSLTLLLCSEVFDIFPSPFVIFDLKCPMEAGLTFYRDDLWWKYWLRHWVRNVDFGRVAYLFYFYQFLNGFQAPVGNFEKIKQSLNLVQTLTIRIWGFNDHILGLLATSFVLIKDQFSTFMFYFKISIYWAIELQIGRFKGLSCEIFWGKCIGELGISFGDWFEVIFFVLTAIKAHFRAQLLGNF